MITFYDTIIRLTRLSCNPCTINDWILTFSMLAYCMLKYPLKCAPAVTVGAHFSGYISNK